MNTYVCKLAIAVSWGILLSAASAQTTSVLTSPATGATVSPLTQFGWTSVSGATDYVLWVGTTPNAKDALYYNAGTGTSTSATLQPGTTYYTTLFTFVGSNYTVSRSSFQTSATAVLSTPANGATDLDSGQPIAFSWTAIAGVTSYELMVGTSVGANNSFESGAITTSSTSATLNPNTTYYARLVTTANGTATHTDTLFSTGYPLAHLTYPLNGATNVSQFQPFTWNQAAGATGYVLIVSPTGYGTPDFYWSAGAALVPTVTSQYVPALQPETTYYVDLCTNNPGQNGGTCIKSSFTTGTAAPLPPDRNSFYQQVLSLTAQVRLMTQGTSDIPTPGTPLNNEMLSYGGIPALSAKCGDFTITLLNLFTQNGILARKRGLSSDGMDTHVVAEYWDPFNQHWQVADSYFGDVYFSLQTQTGQSADDINNLLLSGKISSIEPLFVTSNGALYATSYFMDPVLFYINPQPFGLISAQAELNYVPNSPLPFMNPASSSAAGAAGLYIFSFANHTDSIQVQNGSSTIVMSPGNTEGYASCVNLVAGWSIVSPLPPGMSMYTYQQVYNYNNPNIYIVPVTSATPLLVTPGNGAIVEPQQIQFYWATVPEAISYTLWVGTTPGAKDALYYTTAHLSNPAGVTGTAATLLPGTTYYATMWAQTPSGDKSTKSTFQTVAMAYLLAPAAGANVSPATQFNWTSVPSATDYVLWVGTTPNASNALYYNAGTGTSTSATLLPGTTYYTTLFTFVGSNCTISQSSFQTEGTAHLTAPALGSTVAPQTQFSWTSIPGAVNYTLWVGNTPNAKDVLYFTTSHSANPAGVTSTSATLQPGQTYYTTLFTQTATGSTHSTSSFQTSATSYLIAPAAGATTSPLTQVSWVNVPGATDYVLWVGTTFNAKDALYYNAGTGTSTSATLLPGTTYYTTLFTFVGSNYTVSRSSFQTAATAYLTAPASGATVSPQSIQFTWTAVTGVISYTLWIGTTPGAKDALYYTTAHASNPAGITSTTATLQADTTYYATMWTLTSAGYTTTTSTFHTAAMSYLTYPANGATDVNPFQPFTWTQTPGAENYVLAVSPTNFQTWDNFAADFAGSVVSEYVWDLQPGTLYYATLCTFTASGSKCSNSTFTTAAADQKPPSRSAFYATIKNLTAQVRLMAQFGPDIAAVGTYLYQTQLNHNENPANGASCGDFASALADLLTKNGVLARERQTNLDGGDVHVMVEYWDIFNNKWQIADPTFGVMYFDPNTEIGQGVEDLNGLLLSGNLSAITPLWVTNYGSAYMTTFYMDPIVYYNNPYPYGAIEDEQLVYNNVPNSPLPFLTPFSVSTQNPPSAYMFLFAHQNDQVTVNNAGTSLTITPISTSGWSPTVGLHAGWTIVSSIPDGMQIYTPLWLPFPTPTSAVLTAPISGWTVPPQSIQFAWTAVPGVINYTLWIGTTPGAKDALYYTTAHASNPAGITSTTATLPADATYYVTLWTLTSTGSTTTTSTFQTAATAYLTAPQAGSTAATQAQFNWTSVPGATNYVLWVGTTPNAKDALYYNAGTATSANATLQSGTTYYTTLFTYIGSNDTISRSSFQTAATAYLTAPALGSTVAPQAQFSWTSVSEAVNYTLWVGSTPNAKDVLYFTTAHSANPAGITSASAMLQPGKTYYTTLFTQTATGSTHSTSSFQTSATSYLITPAAGATAPPLTQFTWVNAPGATDYVLWVGTTFNANDALYYNAGTGTSTSATLHPGTTYYTTLFTFVGSNYTVSRSSFPVAATAVLSTPANGATNLDSGQPIAFSWSAIAGVTSYDLMVGTSVGANNVFDSGAITTSSASATLNPNTNYYGRLVTTVNATATYTDSVFSTGYPLAHLTYPLNGATGISQFLPFTWNQVQGAERYKLTVSLTGYGVADFFAGIRDMIPTDTSEYVWALQPNTTYYARLCTINPGPKGGGCVNSSFTTGNEPPQPTDANAFYQSVQSLTAQVRAMTQGFTDVPTPGTYLYQMAANHGGDPTQGVSCGWFAAALLDQFTMNGILARQRNISLHGTDGHVLTEYWDPFNQKWELADSTFGAVYFDPDTQLGQGAEDVNALLLAGNYSAINPLFVSPYGSQWMTHYHLDPITMFNEVDPFGMLNATDELNYLPNPPAPFLNPVPLSVVGTAGDYVFQFANPTDSITALDGSGNHVISPVNNEGWASSVYLNTGWSILSAVPDGMQMYTFKRILF
jgi:hypothetical protein